MQYELDWVSNVINSVLLGCAIFGAILVSKLRQWHSREDRLFCFYLSHNIALVFLILWVHAGTVSNTVEHGSFYIREVAAVKFGFTTWLLDAIVFVTALSSYHLFAKARRLWAGKVWLWLVVGYLSAIPCAIAQSVVISQGVGAYSWEVVYVQLALGIICFAATLALTFATRSDSTRVEKFYRCGNILIALVFILPVTVNICAYIILHHVTQSTLHLEPEDHWFPDYWHYFLVDLLSFSVPCLALIIITVVIEWKCRRLSPLLCDGPRAAYRAAPAPLSTGRLSELSPSSESEKVTGDKS